MSEKWPPPGFAFYYRMETHQEGYPSYSMDVLLPKAREVVDISTFRISRHGGPNEADFSFRDRLYREIGSIVVAAGHVESTMKRLVLVLKADQGGFSVVDKTWSDLHKMLVSQTHTGAPHCKNLAEVLDWGESNDLKRRRDDVVHASWWDWDGVGVTRSRFFRKQDGVTIVGTFEELAEDSRLLSEYAEKLDALLGTDWPQARLPQ
ncbi:hypothetical protein PV702_06495 [Streptomyces sp. FL06-04B]|uniref:hypothetical protein n=1 Tax=Streptomyces TaxID=1883 RepID=UPI0029A857F7|nr:MULTISPECIES: hypothetical protein [unclassified Streptomyces]MDX2919798.1 hypothetical protein [Streptomyces sp. NE06-03C]MDX3606119.1 hypothetical protein [Streptomyces sp. FL06-04B]MDX3735353.1 hypothetical protein [Streptomyces sp. ID01-15D]